MPTTETAPYAPHPPSEEIIFAGGGEMGAMMRAFDWAASPLGPVSAWPPSLRMAVSLCLNSQFPTIIFWGPDLLMFYNDAYLPIADDKHPAALGRPAREFWAEVWSIAGPMLHGVLETGQATWSTDLFLPIIHNGAVGEHYFTFSYSPIRDEAGMVRGVFCPVAETTARVQQERREQRLRAEAEAARDQVTYVLESMSDSFMALDAQWRITTANASAAAAMHHQKEHLLGKVYWEEFPLTRSTNLYPAFHRAMADRVSVEFESYYPPWGCWYDVRVYPAREGGLSVFFRDVTARKHAEAALRESEVRHAFLLELSDALRALSDPVAIQAEASRLLGEHLDVTRVAYAEIVGDEMIVHRDYTNGVPSMVGRYPKAAFGRKVVDAFFHSGTHRAEDLPSDPDLSQTEQDALAAINCAAYLAVTLAKGGRLHAAFAAHSAVPRVWTGEETVLIEEVGDRIWAAVERARAEAALHDSEERLRLATDSAGVGIWHYYIQEDRLLWSPQFKRLFGLPPDDTELTYGQFLAYVHPQDLERMNTVVGQVIAEGKDLDIEYRVVWPDGSVHWIAAKGSAFQDDRGRAVRFTGVALDATARKQAEEAREGLLAELRRVNDELQQFAYIASHDLSEPLRMVTNFVSMLAKRYQGKLDADADDYIGFAVDGARRMQQMLTDLLAYTRLGGPARSFTAVNSEEVLTRVLDALQLRITDCDAIITHDSLPTVQGDATRLGQVFQNLIGNALKFRGAGAARIHVSAIREDRYWRFAVRDNGIGLDPRHAERIFQAFQRLHTHGEYAGTGMGLAICKKIIEQHGGRIWVESRPGEGSIFYFTISDIEERGRWTTSHHGA